MKRKLIWVVAAMIIAVTGMLLYNFTNRERLFLDRAFVQLSGGRGAEYMEAIKLGSGDSVAMILEHDCCSGAGFDAVAIRTSDGQEFFSKKNYCGLEGFYHELGAEAVKDLARFKSFLSTQGYQKR